MTDLTQAPAPAGTLADLDEGARIRPFDFSRSLTVERGRLRLLRPLFDNLAGSMSSLLTSRLRQFVRVRVDEEWRQVSWDEYAATVPDPTVLALATVSPNEWHFALHLPIEHALTVIDFLLGGDGKNQPARPDLTEIERGLLQPLLGEIWLNTALPALSGLIEFHLTNSTLTNSAMLVQLGALSERCLVIDLWLTFENGAERCTSIVMPIPALLPVIESIERTQSNDRAAREVSWEDVAASLATVTLDMKVSYPAISLTSEEVIELREGDVIALGPRSDSGLDHLDLVVGDAVFARGVLTEGGRNLAVTVLSTEELFL